MGNLLWTILWTVDNLVDSPVDSSVDSLLWDNLRDNLSWSDVTSLRMPSRGTMTCEMSSHGHDVLCSTLMWDNFSSYHVCWHWGQPLKRQPLVRQSAGWILRAHLVG